MNKMQILGIACIKDNSVKSLVCGVAVTYVVAM